MKIKVAHVINSFGLGGVPQVAYQLLRSLSADSYELYLYVLKSYHDNPGARKQLEDRFREIGVTVRSPNRDEKKFYVVTQLMRWLLEDKVDILHTHSYKPNIYGRLAGLLCKQNGLKIVAHYHNYYDNKWAEDDSLLYEKQLMPSTDHFLACSASVANHIAENVGINKTQVEVLLNGIDLDRFTNNYDPQKVKTELALPPDCKIIGTVGRLCNQKAQDIFLQAAAIIHQSYPKTLFLIAGAADDPSILDNLTRQAEALDIQHSVRFLGYIADIPRIYSVLDLLVMPSRWEGFGLSLVEAMAMGLPIVATEVGGIPEVVVKDESALLVPPENAGAIAEAVKRLLADPTLITSFSNAGRNRAAQFSYRRIGQEVHHCYQRLVSESYQGGRL